VYSGNRDLGSFYKTSTSRHEELQLFVREERILHIHAGYFRLEIVELIELLFGILSLVAELA
jgi:hypothetical protein